MTTTARPASAVEPAELALFYAPGSVAVVGAHDKRGGLAQFTASALRLCERTGGGFHPVNPRRESVYGVPCVPSVAELPDNVDVLCIFTADPIGVLEQAADAGRTARFVMVFANGFGELGTPAGLEKEQRLREAVRAVGGRLIGPNTNLNAWDPRPELPGRKIAVVAQSGNQGRPIVEAQQVGVGISFWAPTGNEADLEAADFIEFFASDPDTAVICGYIEGFRSGQRLREAAMSAAEHNTPIALVKVGRTATGATVAQSHTGHLAGSDEVTDAFLEQYGIVRVDELDELTEIGIVLARCSVPKADGLAVISASGGTAAHMADLAEVAGLPMPTLLPETRNALRELIPAEFRIDNPVDNGGPVMFGDSAIRIWEIVLDDPQVGVLVCPVPASSGRLTRAVVDAILAVAPTATKPILPVWLGPYDHSDGYDDLWQAGLPVLRNIRGALLAAKALLANPSRNTAVKETISLARTLPPIPDQVTPGTTLDEAGATRWLSRRGFVFADNRDASTPDEAVAAADEMGYPVVVKGTGVAHKSEADLVAVGLRGPDDVRAAAAGMSERGAAGLLVARHESGGVEFLVGLSTDPIHGPVVVVGAGGVTAEAVRDVARSVLPLTRARVETMLDRLRIAPLLRGWRGSPPLAREALIDTVLRVGELAASGDVVELDINPLLVRPDGVVGLDALVRLRAGVRP